MSRFLVLLVAIVVVLGAIDSAHWVARAEWGDDDRLSPAIGLTDGDTTLASIDLGNCDDGAIATWRHAKLTFQIVNTSDVDSGKIQAIRSGVLEWNNVGGPYSLTEVTAGAADITIEVAGSITGDILGRANVACATGKDGIQSASIILAVNGLKLVGLTNLSAHEAGHALGLRHSDKEGDLMDPNFNRKLEGKSLVCPSNLDVGGLSAESDPYRISASSWATPTTC